MTFAYFQTDNGKVILTWQYKNYRERRVFSVVNLEKLNALAAKHNLTEMGKVKLLLKLKHIRNIFDIGRVTDTSSADTAVARWIGDIERSITRIANAKVDDASKFMEALGAMEVIGNEWVKDKIKCDGNDVDARNSGFDVQYVRDGYISTGAHLYIKRWFEQAKMIEHFAKDAKKRLRKLNRPQNRLRMEMSKETLLYGKQLPDLYSQITKKNFGISKDRDSVARKNGVAFVLDCAEAIGLPAVTPSNVASHWNKLKRQIKG